MLRPPNSQQEIDDFEIMCRLNARIGRIFALAFVPREIADEIQVEVCLMYWNVYHEVNDSYNFFITNTMILCLDSLKYRKAIQNN